MWCWNTAHQHSFSELFCVDFVVSIKSKTTIAREREKYLFCRAVKNLVPSYASVLRAWCLTDAVTFGFFTNAQHWQYLHYCQLCIPIYLQFPSLFATYDIGKYDIKYQWMQYEHISRLQTSLVKFIANGTAETIEFFLNEFPWIQRIQWIVTKSKSGMVT